MPLRDDESVDTCSKINFNQQTIFFVQISRPKNAVQSKFGWSTIQENGLMFLFTKIDISMHTRDCTSVWYTFWSAV